MVVGAGPAGAACAMSLAKLGFTVDVIEARPDGFLLLDRKVTCAACAHMVLWGLDGAVGQQY